MASQLSVRRIIDSLDGKGSGPTMVDFVTKVIKWNRHRAALTQVSRQFHTASWTGMFEDASVRFTLKSSTDTPDPMRTLEVESTIKIILMEGNNTESVISCRRGMNRKGFGRATVRHFLQAVDGSWRFPTHQHPLVYLGWDARFQDWLLSGAKYNPENPIISDCSQGGAIRTALHLLEVSVDKERNFLLDTPTIEVAERALLQAIHAEWATFPSSASPRVRTRKRT